MSLPTQIIITEPVDPREIFDHCLSLISRQFPGTPGWDHIQARRARASSTNCGSFYRTERGQRLPVALFVHHAPADGPPLVYHDAQLAAWHLTDDPTWDPPWWDRHQVRVEFATPTDYRADNGADAGDLHAWLVAQLRQWLAAKGIHQWVWEDEQARVWHDPGDPLDPLGDPDLGALTVE